MRLSALIKIVAAFIVLTVLTCTALIVHHHIQGKSKGGTISTIRKFVPEQEKIDLVQIDELKKTVLRKDRPEIVLGAPALRKAKKLLQEGGYNEAEELLQQIVLNYEDTPAEREAYRILGEMNMDELFEIRENDDRFVPYIVKPGDTYLGIVEDHHTNFDLMMLINHLTSKNSNRLQPKQKLLLMPLHFSLRIIPRKNQLFLLDSAGKVVKMYEPVIDMTIPNKKEKLSTQIWKIRAYYQGKRVNATRGNYRDAEKIIKIQNPLIEIIGDASTVSSDFKGIVLSKPDMEELVLLLRGGNKVEILY